MNGEGARPDGLAGDCLLDGPVDPRLHAIVSDAAEQLHAPVGLLTVVGPERQRIVTSVGTERTEFPLDECVCTFTIRGSDVLVVEDLSTDERFRAMSCVCADGLRFYAGAPLVLRDGARVGTLCVFDLTPRSDFDASDRAVLARLAARAVAEFEIGRDLRRETRDEPGCEAEWLALAQSLLGRAALTLERCNATGALAKLQETIDAVDQLTRSEPV